MYLQLNANLILVLNIFLFWTSTFILNFLTTKIKNTNPLNKSSYTLYLSLFMWLLVALPLTTIFLVKTNLLLSNPFNSTWTSILFIILNTQILLIYYKYYNSLINRVNVKYISSVSLKQNYRFIWANTMFLFVTYLLSYIILTLL